MTSAKQQYPRGHTIPIIIGVTGHRDLRPQDLPELKNQVRNIFKDLRRDYPATPLLVMSPLAEGADRLVAEVALEKDSENQNLAYLLAPFPMAVDEYEKDFETEQSLRAFRNLRAQALASFELPLLAGATRLEISKDGPERDKQYAQVGAYIARHSHILIGLWDGVESNQVGGTAQIVEFKLNGIPAPFEPTRKLLDIVDNGPVYHILTPRLKNPDGIKNPFCLSIRFPEGWTTSDSWPGYQRILSRMNAFNLDVERLLPNRQEALNRNMRFVIPEPKHLSSQSEFILETYAAADTLAIHFQKRRRATLITLFSFAVAAVLSFEVYAHLFQQAWVMALYPLTLGLAVLTYVLAGRWDFQNKHVDYRALAEGLRVQLFWNLAGLKDEVADHYLRQHRTDLEWIRNAIRARNALAHNLSDATDQAQDGQRESDFGLVVKHWIEDQRRFFSDATYRDSERLASGMITVRGLFFTGFLLAGLLVLSHVLSIAPDEHSRLWHFMIVVIGILPAIAAAFGGYAEKMAFSAQAKRYEWMTSLFTRALEQMRKIDLTNGDGAARQLILDLGTEALEENGNWVAMHRERVPDVYKGS